MGYEPSPRPTFDRPTALPFADVTRHTWGNPEAGLVEDWIYVSSDLLHTIIFGLDPGRPFRHSEDFRTIFGADEALHVLQGTFVIANPETCEVLRVEEGESVFFRKDTWHHGFSYGAEPVRMLEFFAPPPSTGTSGPYARTKEYLPEERWSYADDEIVGGFFGAATSDGTMRVIRRSDRSRLSVTSSWTSSRGPRSAPVPARGVGWLARPSSSGAISKRAPCTRTRARVTPVNRTALPSTPQRTGTSRCARGHV